MNRYDRRDGTRCVLVKPGDVLILAGAEPTDELKVALERLVKGLALQWAVVLPDDVELAVRDLNEELAEAQRSLEDYRVLFDQQQKLFDKVMAERDALLNPHNGT